MLNILGDEPLQEAPSDENTNEVHSMKELVEMLNIECMIEIE